MIGRGFLLTSMRILPGVPYLFFGPLRDPSGSVGRGLGDELISRGRSARIYSGIVLIALRVFETCSRFA
ncbi:hypothetical protein PSAB6_100033 [Paraburkholderia sabiae]|nr:hypothetical protein PSAB6_100033 [Paraburkholderia sabiae]